VVTLQPPHVALIAAVVLLAAGAAYVSRKGKKSQTVDSARGIGTVGADATGRAERRADQVARLTSPSEASIRASAAAGLSDQRLRARALDVSAQVRALAAEWAGQSEKSPERASSVGGGEERRTPERLGAARHEGAKALYQRIRHEAIEVRMAMLERRRDVASGPIPVRREATTQSCAAWLPRISSTDTTSSIAATVRGLSRPFGAPASELG
jgi:hypothetical protein